MAGIEQDITRELTDIIIGFVFAILIEQIIHTCSKLLQRNRIDGLAPNWMLIPAARQVRIFSDDSFKFTHFL
jgi:hypothetical protein